VIFAICAYRQSIVQVERDLDFAGGGVIARADEILASISASLDRAGVLATSGKSSAGVLAELRGIVFTNRHLQGIAIIRDGKIICTSEQIYEPPLPLDGAELAALPGPGELKILPPAKRAFAPDSISITRRISANLVLLGAADPRVLTEYFDDYAERTRLRVLIYVSDGKLLASFGPGTIRAPALAELPGAGTIQWRKGSLVKVARSAAHPIFTAAISRPGAVAAQLTRSGLPLAMTGVGVSALLVGLMVRIARRTRSLEADLREAIRFGEIDVFYQPIIDLRSGRCAGAEALMRWRHPRRGVIPAGEFIAIAEDTGLILPMTDMMLGKIADDLAELFAADRSLHIGINLAPQHFASERILSASREFLDGRIDPAQVIYEITERGLVSDEDSVARAVMNGLIGRGAKLAVDDFGTGYSSLSYLERFPLNFLKIDKAFVDGISDAATSSGLVDQIIRISRSLEMEIIAEGVEHDFQAEYLRAHGVEYAQGWFFARPLPAPEFRKIVREKNSAPGGGPALRQTSPDSGDALDRPRA
jgi:sensor c-di-GMP phosphodiesterase-like protein